MKLLNIIICSDCEKEMYSEMFKCLKTLYQIYSNHSIVKVKTIFIRYNENINESYIDDGVLYMKGVENMIPGILNKTLDCFQYFEKELHEYDYIIRTNLSTIIDFHLLAKQLKETPIKFFGGGSKKTLSWLGGGIVDSTWYGTDYIEGTCLIFTNDSIKYILSKRDCFRTDIIDDVSFGIFMREHKRDENIRIECLKNNSTLLNVPCFIKDNKININQMTDMVSSNKHIFYRNKCYRDYRKIDVIQMNIIKDILIEKEKKFLEQ